MLTCRNNLLRHILQELEKSPNRLFRTSELKSISATDFNMLHKEKLLKFYQYEPEGDEYPCPTKDCGNTCDRVVARIRGKWEAVCPDGEVDTRPILLSDADITKYSFNLDNFMERLRQETSVSKVTSKLDERLHFIGTKEIYGKPIALLLGLFNKPKTAELLLLGLPQILPETFEATFVFMPSFKDISSDVLKILENNRIYPEILKEWNLTGIIQKRIPQPGPSEKIPVKFPTPAGTQWVDITIEFIDDWSVTISAKEVTKRYGFEKMGFGDGRRGAMPNKLWDILKELAKGHGTLSWKSKGSKLKLQTPISRLRKQLKKFFNLKNDPFFPYDQHKAYKTKFTVSDKSFTPEPKKDKDDAFFAETDENNDSIQ